VQAAVLRKARNRVLVSEIRITFERGSRTSSRHAPGMFSRPERNAGFRRYNPPEHPFLNNLGSTLNVVITVSSQRLNNN
jgi:hypothetical protein